MQKISSLVDKSRQNKSALIKSDLDSDDSCISAKVSKKISAKSPIAAKSKPGRIAVKPRIHKVSETVSEVKDDKEQMMKDDAALAASLASSYRGKQNINNKAIKFIKLFRISINFNYIYISFYIFIIM